MNHLWFVILEMLLDCLLLLCTIYRAILKLYHNHSLIFLIITPKNQTWFIKYVFVSALSYCWENPRSGHPLDYELGDKCCCNFSVYNTATFPWIRNKMSSINQATLIMLSIVNAYYQMRVSSISLRSREPQEFRSACCNVT